MDNLNAIIASNIKALRSEKKLSLDRMAEITGVSKSMIGQIERGVSTPTISTMVKLASGLKLPIGNLLSRPQPPYTLLRKEALQTERHDGDRVTIHPYFPFSSERSFETHVIEIDKNGHYVAPPYNLGSWEYVIVFKGRLTLRLDGQEHILEQGDAIHFKADLPHSYYNLGGKTVRVQMLIQYPAP